MRSCSQGFSPTTRDRRSLGTWTASSWKWSRTSSGTGATSLCARCSWRRWIHSSTRRAGTRASARSSSCGRRRRTRPTRLTEYVPAFLRLSRWRVANVFQGHPPQPPRPQNFAAPPTDPHSQNYFARSHSNKLLPNPVELANRLEEARTSAKLLSQLVANTPSTEVLDNDLVKEFADRCLSASRSIQGYMTAENPGPDNETMESLIDVNEELQQALNNEKRARLSARKELGLGDRSENVSPAPEVNGSNRPPMPEPSGSYAAQGGAFPSGGAYAGDSAPPLPRKPLNNGKGKGRQEPDPADYVPPPPGPPPGHPSAAGPSRSANATPADEGQDPFRDPEPAGPRGGGAPQLEEPRLADEPFHPGFGEPTRSYIGRQDSAFNKVTMHGAGYGPSDQDGDKEVASPVAGYSGGYSGSSSATRPRNVSDLSEDIYNPPPSSSEAYGGSSSGKRPVYRY
ncbi:hypothetical protein FJTKL_02392 [Diaporthe vaccinii]|uniref:GAT domain-containing protein n=1 Tax=Diaporthe vaccinii TaxID=105482 RepID=A0ABR4F3Y6_9PEZI